MEKIRAMRTPAQTSTITAERGLTRVGTTSPVGSTRTLEFTRGPTISTRLPKIGDSGLVHTDRPVTRNPIKPRVIPSSRAISATFPSADRRSITQRDTAVSKKEWSIFNRHSTPLWEKPRGQSPATEKLAAPPVKQLGEKLQKITTEKPLRRFRKSRRYEARRHRIKMIRNHNESRFQQVRPTQPGHRYTPLETEQAFQKKQPDVRPNQLQTQRSEIRPNAVKVNPEMARKTNVTIFDRRAFMTQGRVSQKSEMIRTVKPYEASSMLQTEQKPVRSMKQTQTRREKTPIRVTSPAIEANKQQALLTYNRLLAAKFPDSAARSIVTKAIGSNTWIEPKPQTKPVSKTIIAVSEAQKTHPKTTKPETDIRNQTQPKVEPQEQMQMLEAMKIMIERQQKLMQKPKHYKYWYATQERIKHIRDTVSRLFSKKTKFVTGSQIAAHMETRTVPVRFKSSIISPYEHDGTYTRNVTDISRLNKKFRNKDEAILAAEAAVNRNPAVTIDNSGTRVRRDTVMLAQSRRGLDWYMFAAQALLNSKSNYTLQSAAI